MRHVHPLGRRILDAIFSPKPAKITTDAWENAATGLGTLARDKAMHATFCRGPSLSLDWEKLEALYHDDDVSGRIVDIFPDHMFRKGWDLSVVGDKTGQKARAFNKYAKKLKLKERCKEAERWGRLKGGALLLLGIDDDRTIDQPVDEANIKSIKYINVIERQYILVDRIYTDPFSGKLGEPELYRITNTQIGPGQGGDFSASTSKAAQGSGYVYTVHESRVIRFDGAPTSTLEKQHLGGFTHTVLQRPYEKIKAFVQAFQASSNLMTDASQGVYKLEGLIGQIASNEKELLEARMMMMDMGRSVARSIILDKDGEEFERTVATITGYPEMLDRFMMLLSSATGIPVTLLMGRSAAGMNATGDSDFRQFYDVVESKQVNELQPKLECAYRYIGLAQDGPMKKGKKAEPKIMDDVAGPAVPAEGNAEAEDDFELEFAFRSLWTLTTMERSQCNFTQSQADLNYVTMGAATGEEIAMSRFHEDGDVHLSTKIDIEGRRAAMDAAKTFDPYESAEDEDVSGEMDLKRQGKAPEPVMPMGGPGANGGSNSAPSNGRAGKVTRPNSSQPGYKPKSGR